MNDFELQQLMKQQGLLGGVGELGQQNNSQNIQDLLGRSQQLTEQMAQNAQAQNQSAIQTGQQNLQAQKMTGQQALAQQQQEKAKMAGMIMNFLPMGKWLGAAGSSIKLCKILVIIFLQKMLLKF